MLGRYSALESHAVGLGDRISVPVFDKIQPLLLLERRLEIGRLADEAGLALLADAASEQRLDEDELVPIDQALDLVFGRTRTQDLGRRKLDMLEQSSSIQHSGDLHSSLQAAVGRRFAGAGSGDAKFGSLDWSRMSLRIQGHVGKHRLGHFRGPLTVTPAAKPTP